MHNIYISMRPLLLFLVIFIVSLSGLAWQIIYLSPTDNTDKIVVPNLIQFLLSLSFVIFSLTTVLAFFLNRFFDKTVRNKPFADQKLHLRRYWKIAIRRGLLVAVLISGLVAFKVFGLNNQLNIGLLFSIVLLTEILLWRYYFR